MRYAAAAAALAGVAAAGSWGPPAGGDSWGAPTNGSAPVYVTEVVTAFTTYCPVATAITHAGQTYTVSSATTLTITNCPGGCTITKPVSSSTPVAPVSSSSAPAAPVTTSKSSPVAPVGTGATASSKGPVGTGKPAASGTAASTGVSKPTSTGSPITPYTGAGVQVQAGIAGVLAVFGLVAAL